MKITVTQLRRIIREEVQKVVRGKGRLAEGHARITSEELEAWKSGDWGYVGEALGGMMPGRDDKFMHPTAPPSAPKCADCGKKMSPAEKDAYEAEGGQGYPEVCMDCAEMV